MKQTERTACIVHCPRVRWTQS